VIRWAIACVALYAVFVGALLVAGRRGQARALAGFIPDCIVLVRRLLGDERLSRSRKAVLAGLVAYLALPFDLVPDFIPIAGQLDDAILVAVVLRAVFRDAGPAALREHWPGPEESLRVLMRIVSTTTTGAGRRRWHGR
jgi:uncharacterized membrane protein YkvA (DUF1232 family)